MKWVNQRHNGFDCSFSFEVEVQRKVPMCNSSSADDNLTIFFLRTSIQLRNTRRKDLGIDSDNFIINEEKEISDPWTKEKKQLEILWWQVEKQWRSEGYFSSNRSIFETFSRWLKWWKCCFCVFYSWHDWMSSFKTKRETLKEREKDASHEHT